MTKSISEVIKELQKIQEEHGDLGMYEYGNSLNVIPFSSTSSPRVVKIYNRKYEDYPLLKGYLSNGDISKANEDLHDVDLTKPIKIGVIFN